MKTVELNWMSLRQRKMLLGEVVVVEALQVKQLTCDQNHDCPTSELDFVYVYVSKSNSMLCLIYPSSVKQKC